MPTLNRKKTMKLLMSKILLIAIQTLFIFFASYVQAQEKICTELSTPSPGGTSLTALSNCKWNKDTLTVKFLDGDRAVQNKVTQYANEWTKHANLKFKFVTSGNADIRISFKKPGSWSYVGLCIPSTLGQNDATMNYGWLTPTTQDEEYSRVVLHEFGHTLGFVHEHQSPSGNIPWNRDAVEKYYAQQGWSKSKVEEQIFKKYSKDETNGTAYDKFSIMHYAIPASLTIGGYEVPWNTKLSAQDISFANSFYPHRFTKNGNNGTVSCDTFCGAVNGYKTVWGKEPGYCVKATNDNTGKIVGCDSSVGLLPSGKQLSCDCNSGVNVRHGNNGTISCNDFCKRTNNEECVAGWNTVTNKNIDATCDHVAGNLRGPEVTCTCR
jgi:serralysin